MMLEYFFFYTKKKKKKLVKKKKFFVQKKFVVKIIKDPLREVSCLLSDDKDCLNYVIYNVRYN
jgi:hypothetical protein